jgi:hypothetical protein
MRETKTYRDWLRRDTETLIDSMDLDDIEKHFLRSRWLDQVIWMETRADKARSRYFTLRLLAALGGVVVPVLVSLSTTGTTAGVVRGITVGLSLIVAMSVAVEELMRFGERFRQYRRTVEHLKSEGWQYFQLSGPYRRHATHRVAYPYFATRVEGIIEPSVEVYVTEIMSEKDPKRNEPVPTP